MGDGESQNRNLLLRDFSREAGLGPCIGCSGMKLVRTLAVAFAVLMAQEVLSGDLLDSARPRTEFIIFSATVRDHKVTELIWHENGARHRAFSNIDFNLFSGIGAVDLGDTCLLYLMAIGNQPSFHPWLRTPLLVPPADDSAIGKLPTDYSAFVLVEGSPAPGGRVAGLLSRLHEYYDSNQIAVIAAFKERQAERAAQAEELKANPPPPADAPLSFWLEKSREYSEAVRAGSQVKEIR